LADADVAAAPPMPTITFRNNAPGEPRGGVGFADGNSGEFEGNEGVVSRQDNPAPLQLVGDRTFVLRDGKWIDTSYDADTMDLRELVFLGDEYFELLDQDERVAEFYALGERVIFVLDGQAYEVVPE
jgi:hypothetical protein